MSEFGKVCPVTFDVAVASRAEKCQPGKKEENCFS
jgi:hypothetical protein